MCGMNVYLLPESWSDVTDAGAAPETSQRSSAGGIEFPARAGRSLVLTLPGSSGRIRRLGGAHQVYERRGWGSPDYSTVTANDRPHHVHE
jgi:hypothetical protein